MRPPEPPSFTGPVLEYAFSPLSFLFFFIGVGPGGGLSSRMLIKRVEGSLSIGRRRRRRNRKWISGVEVERGERERGREIQEI